MPISSLILPFAVKAEDNTILPPSMETASILLLAETKRRKAGLFGTPEEIAFISKMHYPFWLTPWEGKTLILDGLSTASSLFIYHKLPSLEAFIENVERSLCNRTLFRKTLAEIGHYFEDFSGQVEFRVEALISNEALLSTLQDYLQASSSSVETNPNVVLVPPKIDVKKAMEHTTHFSQLYSCLHIDLSGLEYVKKVLNEALSFHEKMIRREIEYTRAAYADKMSMLQPEIAERVKAVEKRRDAELASLEKTFERELKVKQRQLERLENMLVKLEAKKIGLKKRRDSAGRKRKVSLARMEHQIKSCDAKIRELKSRIHGLKEVLAEAERRREAEIEKLQQSYEAQIEKEKAAADMLTAKLEEEIKAKNAEIEALRLTVEHIQSQIDRLIEVKMKDKKQLEAIALPRRVDEASLLCVPFYLVGYRGVGKTRIMPIPPVKAAPNTGFLKTRLPFIRSSKISLTMRSKALSEMLDSAVKNILSSDKAYSRAFRSAVSSANILSLKGFRKLLEEGVRLLKERGWISTEEEKIFTKYL